MLKVEGGDVVVLVVTLDVSLGGSRHGLEPLVRGVGVSIKFEVSLVKSFLSFGTLYRPAVRR